MTSLWFWAEIAQARMALEWDDEVRWVGPLVQFWQPIEILGVLKNLFDYD